MRFGSCNYSTVGWYTDSVILGLVVRTSLRALCYRTHFASDKKIASVGALELVSFVSCATFISLDSHQTTSEGGWDNTWGTKTRQLHLSRLPHGASRRRHKSSFDLWTIILCHMIGQVISCVCPLFYHYSPSKSFSKNWVYRPR